MEAMELWHGMQYAHAPGTFPLNTDAFALADFASPGPTGRVVDLGCGCGIISLLLLARLPKLSITGIELSEKAADMARNNIAKNGLQEQLCVVQGDLRSIRTLLEPGQYDYVVANPPYYPLHTGAVAADSGRAMARSETTCTLEDICWAARWLTRFGGSFACVYKPERLTDLFSTLRSLHLEPKRMRMVTHRPGKAASLVLVESRHGGKPGLSMEPDLVLQDPQGNPTADYARIYGRTTG